MVQSLYPRPSIITRIAVGKGVGFLIGLAGFVALPWLWPEAPELLRWGMVLWYATMGAIIGVFGVLSHNPVLMLPMPWWVRAPIIGAWLNFVLTFFAYEAMQAAIVATLGVSLSPFWFVAEGAVVGAVIGYLATRIGGEGWRTVEMMDEGSG